MDRARSRSADLEELRAKKTSRSRSSSSGLSVRRSHSQRNSGIFSTKTYHDPMGVRATSPVSHLRLSPSEHNRLLPVARLPEDVLRLIFSLLAQPIPRSPPASKTARQLPPAQVRLSHVSRHWRAVALSTASLWTDLRVSGPEDLEVVHHLVDTRAAQAPLQLDVLDLQAFFKGHLGGCTSELDILSTKHEVDPGLIRFLHAHLPRITSLNIAACKHSLPQLLLHHLPPASSLHSVHITPTNCKYLVSSPALPSPFLTPLHAPNLRTLLVKDLDLPLPLLTPASTTNLTEVSSWKENRNRRSTYTHMLSELQQLSSVRSLRYTFALERPHLPSTVSPHHPIRLTQLRHLELGASLQPAQLAKFWTYLHLPALESLELRDFWTQGGYAGAELVSILQLVPTLRRLVVEVGWNTLPSLLEGLCSSREERLLPSLERLGLECDLPYLDLEPVPGEVLEGIERLICIRGAGEDGQAEGRERLSELWVRPALAEGEYLLGPVEGEDMDTL